ncbi:tRNA (adenosine(37)-N6)-threonylcarbamoyltransferase complex ATPase subunit type 1 TsaE [Candidatus Aerophobetes bacterium]|nr:tRNA (adenosine(37)-N6)-threonylcarbamoyltransferase complex ATPase subunit type 1 TsaE [Candidatus Aerophobetes bacterium]
MMFTVQTKGEEKTLEFGEKIGREISPPFFLALVGELGSGKTIFTKGIAKGVGAGGTVRSPSFILINQYEGPVPLYHFDLYRLKDPRELFQIGYQEYFYDPEGIVVVEWADKIRQLLPSEYLEVIFEIKNLNSRKITLLPRGERYTRFVEQIKRGFKC